MSSTQGPNLESMSYGLAGVNPHNGPGGAKLGESTLLHAGIGAEVGYDSNVFYSTSDNRKGSGVARVTPAVNISNAERDGTLPDGVAYDLTASMGYREYLTSDEDIRKQRAFTPAAGLLLQFSSQQTLSLSVMDNFTRSVDPPYVANADPIRHDYNAGALQLKVAPGGGRLQLTVRGNNVLDYYEDAAYKNASNIGTEGVLDIAWRWLPKTAFFLQAAWGMINYIESNSGRTDSYPLRLTGGIRGLLTEKLALNLGAGYVNTFYASGGANPSGFNNVILFAELIHKLSLTQTAGLGYRHDVRNSPFVGNFYENHAIYAALRQLVAGRVALSGYGRFEYRKYRGKDQTTDTAIDLRTDKVFMAGLTVDYIIARMVYLGVGYNVTYLKTDIPDNVPAGTLFGVDYTKHVVLGRLGFVY